MRGVSHFLAVICYVRFGSNWGIFEGISGPWIPVGNRSRIDGGLLDDQLEIFRSSRERTGNSQLYNCGAVNECTRGKTLTNTCEVRFAREPISEEELFEVPILARSRVV